MVEREFQAITTVPRSIVKRKEALALEVLKKIADLTSLACFAMIKKYKN